MRNGRIALVFIIFIALLLILPGTLLLAKTKDKAEAKKERPPKPKDITEQVKLQNSAKYASPPTQFRQGHITPRKLDPKAITTTPNGFSVQLPSKAPIATPTVYQGVVYASGGFRSKEFYAFDAKTGQLKWAVDIDDDGPSSAVVRDGVIIFNTESCTIFALDAKTGKQIWSWWLGDPLMSTPTIAGNRVFTAYPARGHQAGMAQQEPISAQSTNNVVNAAKKIEKPTKTAPAPPASHVLAAFDLKTGKILWQRWIDSDVMSAPVAHGDELYVTTFAGTMYTFRQKDGAVLSARQVRATSAPVIVDGDMYYTKRADQKGSGRVEETAVKARRTSGSEVLQTNRKAAPYLDGKVQEKAEYKALGGALDAANGFSGGAPASANAQTAFDNVGQANVSTLQAYQGSRILNYGKYNYVVMGNEIICNKAKSGKKRWTKKLSGDQEKAGGFLGTPPVVAGKSIFVATLSGQILQIDPKTGKQIKSYEVGAPVRFQPVVQDGFIYVGTQDGRLVAIDTKNKELTGWPMWGGDAAHTGYRKK
jgi:outer membrane protein assembly factor BamB